MMSGQNGNLTDDQMNELKDRWEDMVDEALSMRDSIADITGYKGGSEEHQSASSKGFETMSQNAADELMAGSLLYMNRICVLRHQNNNRQLLLQN